MFTNSDGPGKEKPSGPLLEDIQRLRKPVNFYEGLEVPVPELPRNIILFQRTLAGGLPAFPGYHHRYLLILALHGSARMHLDQKEVPLSAGHALLVLPYQLHHYSQSNPREITWLMITFEGLEPAAYLSLKDHPVRISDAMNEMAEDAVTTHFDQRRPRGFRNQRLALLVGLLLNDMLDAARSRRTTHVVREPESPTFARMQQVVIHVIGHSREPISIDQLANTFSVSASHLRERFRTTMGMSLGEFIRRTRVHHACKTLATTGLSCSEVADHHGFSSLYAFSRSFKAEFGLSPTAYRKRLRG